MDDCDPNGEGHHLPIGDGDEWVGFQPIPLALAQRGGAWEREFAWAPISDSLHAQLDWDDYHRRGLELAIEIKRVLGPKVRIIYQKPIEDPNYRHQERVEVFEDGNFIALPSLGGMAT